MWLKKFFVVCVTLFLVSCQGEKENSRKSRFLTFNTLNDDINVDLDFTIPFLTIPVKKAASTSFGLSDWDLPTVNINLASLMLGGIVILGSTVFLPHLLKGYAYQNPEERYSRLIDTTDFKTEVILDFMSQLMDNKNVQGCSLRVACWTAQRYSSADSIRMWNQVKSNELLLSMLNSTSVEEAMLMGRSGHDCSTYGPCPLRPEHVHFVLNNIGTLTNRYSNG